MKFKNINFHKLSWSVLDNIVVSASNFLLLALGAKFMHLEEQGKLGLFFSLYIGLVVINLALIHQNAANKSSKVKSKISYENELFLIQVISAFISSCFSLYAFIIFVDLELHQINALHIIVVFFLQQIADFDRRTSYVFSSDKNAFVSSISVYVPRIVLILFIQPDNFHELLNIILISLAPVCLKRFLKYFRDKKNNNPNFLSIVRHLNQSTWLLITIPFMWSWANMPVFLLSKYSGLAAVGVYVTIRSLTSFTSVFLEILETKGSSYFGQKSAENKAGLNDIRDVLINLACVGWVLILILLSLFAENILVILYNSSYSSYKCEVILFWLAQGFIFLFRIYLVHLRSLEKYKSVLFSYIVGSVTVALLSGLFISLNSYNSFTAVITIIIGAFTIYISALYHNSRVEK